MYPLTNVSIASRGQNLQYLAFNVMLLLLMSGMCRLLRVRVRIDGPSRAHMAQAMLDLLVRNVFQSAQ